MLVINILCIKTLHQAKHDNNSICSHLTILHHPYNLFHISFGCIYFLCSIFGLTALLGSWILSNNIHVLWFAWYIYFALFVFCICLLAIVYAVVRFDSLLITHSPFSFILIVCECLSNQTFLSSCLLKYPSLNIRKFNSTALLCVWKIHTNVISGFSTLRFHTNHQE